MLVSRLGSGLLLFVVTGCVTLVPPASAAVECGDVILSDKVLKKDLDCRTSASDVGLAIGADDVNLDLGGHTIIGNSRQSGVTVGHTGVKVMNGTLRTFGVGVRVGGTGNTLSKLVIKGSDEHGVQLGEAAQTTIKGNTIANSERNITVAGVTNNTLIAKNRISGGEVGVDVTQGSGATIRDNRIVESTDAAIAVGGGGGLPVFNTAIERNVLERSEGAGISVHTNPNRVSISENEILDSDDAGIEVFSGSGIAISSNVLLDNGDGIFVSTLQVDPSWENSVGDNMVKRSTIDGILVYDSNIRIQDNQSIANGRWGINSISSNGQGNVARGNGEEPQCQPASLCS